jgi:hypothetical protein
MYKSCIQGDTITLKELITKKISISEDVSARDFWTMLHIASYFGQASTLKLLIDELIQNKNKFDIYNL